MVGKRSTNINSNRILEAFIANKRSKVGKRFGFVRFIGVKNEEMFAKSLASIWIESFHMYASVVRFQRQEQPEAKIKEGMMKAPGLVSAKQVGNVVLLNLSSHMLLLCTEVKNEDKMSNLYRPCREEGLEYVKIHHIGAMSLGRVCIATTQMKFISDMVKVDINVEEYDVHIHKLGSWSINIVDPLSSNSETDPKVDDDYTNKEEFEGEDIIRNHEGRFVIFRDMNEVRDESEWYGTIFSSSEAHTFNSFIDGAHFLDLPIGGHTYTWMNKTGTKMSKLDRTLSLDESRSPEYNLDSDLEENFEEEVAEIMAETMEQYMSKTRSDYGSAIARPKINDKDQFELKGQFLKELRDNTFSGSDHKDVNEHIEKVLEIVDLFHVPNITQDQLMLRVFPMSLTGAERFKELLMKCPQRYLTEIQEVILFYNGLDVPTRQILNSKGVIPTKTAAYAKVAIQEMAEYSQKWHNVTSRTRSTKTSDDVNNVGPYYTKDCLLKEEGKTLKEAYYTQSAKRHEENSNLIKEIQASTNSAIRNQGALIKTLEIQIVQMSKTDMLIPFLILKA
nr:RNA-directed DNA polymerase, eukaryota [Tanacetum cinerariifolium]